MANSHFCAYTAQRLYPLHRLHQIYKVIRLLFLLLLVLCLWYSTSSTLLAAAPRQEVPVPASAEARRSDTLLLGLQPETTPEDVAALIAPYGLEIVEVWPELGLVEVRTRSGAVSASATVAADITSMAQADLSTSPLLRYTAFDAQVQIAQDELPNDPRAAEQWSLTATRASAAWQIGIGEPSVTVAVLDTGYDPNHPDLPAARIWQNAAEANGISGFDDDDNGYVDDINGWDWVDEDNRAADSHGHGTHVTGVVVAATHNSIGISGHGRNLTVAPLRVLDARGTGYISDLIDALEYARQQGFRIANLSLTVASESPALHDAIQATEAAGMLVVAATGNTGGSALWPAAYAETFAVAATTEAAARASFSNYGTAVDIAAPGVNILSTYPTTLQPDNPYRKQSGTSMATPHVSALAGLLWSLRPDYSLADLRAVMAASATDINAAIYPGNDIYIGAGQVDYQAALQMASAELTIQGGSGAFAVVGETVIFPIQVTTPADDTSAQGARGAVVRYEIVGDAANATSTQPAHAITAVDGTTTLTFTAPMTPGNYQVNVNVGSAFTILPVAVHATPVTVTLLLTTTEVTALGEPVTFTVLVDDPAGLTLTETLPLHLQANLGTFANGKSSQDISLNGTSYSGTFFPGSAIGSAEISARIGSSVDSAAIDIVAGPPATLLGPNPDLPVINIAANQMLLTFSVADAYGNPVADGTPIKLVTNIGTLQPATLTTGGGRATTTLSVPVDATGSVEITAIVPETTLQHVTKINLIQRYYLPQLHVAAE